MLSYYAVYTEAQQERGVADRLGNDGYDPFLPVQRYWSRRHKELRDRPLFPRYLFVGFDPIERSASGKPHFDSIKRDRGVRCIVASDPYKPLQIKLGVIDDLRRSEQAGLFDQAGSRLKAGDMVRITEGPFAQMIGRIRDASHALRIQILYEILGAERVIIAPIGIVMRA